jgi:hypothetical protein
MVPDVDGSTDFTMYPNPSANEITIGQELADKKFDNIRLYDASGKLIETFHLKDRQQTIDVSVLSSGLYFVELITKQGEVFDSKFVKQ